MKTRKHALQMTEEELRYCKGQAVHTATHLTVIRHAIDRYSDKHLYVNPGKIKWLVKNSEVVEYERMTKDSSVMYVGMEHIPVAIPAHTNERIVVRAPYDDDFDVSIVLDVTEKKVVTLWLNTVEDRHHTLNLSLYDGTMDIFNKRVDSVTKTC